MTTENTAARSGSFTRAFIMGLVVGVIVGGFAGAFLPPLLSGARPAVKSVGPSGASKTSDRGDVREKEPVLPPEVEQPKPEEQPAPPASGEQPGATGG